MRSARLTRLAFATAVGVAVCLSSYAVASAALAVINAGDLGSGDEAVVECDTDGFVIDGFTLDGSQQITAITVSGIAPACINGSLTVDLTTSANVSVGTGGPVNVTTSPMTVPIPALPAASLVKHEVIIIVGP